MWTRIGCDPHRQRPLTMRAKRRRLQHDQTLASRARLSCSSTARRCRPCVAVFQERYSVLPRYTPRSADQLPYFAFVNGSGYRLFAYSASRRLIRKSVTHKKCGRVIVTPECAVCYGSTVQTCRGRALVRDPSTCSERQCCVEEYGMHILLADAGSSTISSHRPQLALPSYTTTWPSPLPPFSALSPLSWWLHPLAPSPRRCVAVP